ncbi:uncharacterized protein LJ206_002688 [Theristicus caerulescens]
MPRTPSEAREERRPAVPPAAALRTGRPAARGCAAAPSPRFPPPGHRLPRPPPKLPPAPPGPAGRRGQGGPRRHPAAAEGAKSRRAAAQRARLPARLPPRRGRGLREDLPPAGAAVSGPAAASRGLPSAAAATFDLENPVTWTSHHTPCQKPNQKGRFPPFSSGSSGSEMSDQRVDRKLVHRAG